MKRNPVIEDYMRLYPSMCSPKVARIASKVEGRKKLSKAIRKALKK